MDNLTREPMLVHIEDALTRILTDMYNRLFTGLLPEGSFTTEKPPSKERLEAVKQFIDDRRFTLASTVLEEEMNRVTASLLTNALRYDSDHFHARQTFDLVVHYTGEMEVVKRLLNRRDFFPHA